MRTKSREIYEANQVRNSGEITSETYKGKFKRLNNQYEIGINEVIKLNSQ